MLPRTHLLTRFNPQLHAKYSAMKEKTWLASDGPASFAITVAIADKNWSGNSHLQHAYASLVHNSTLWQEDAGCVVVQCPRNLGNWETSGMGAAILGRRLGLVDNRGVLPEACTATFGGLELGSTCNYRVLTCLTPHWVWLGPPPTQRLVICLMIWWINRDTGPGRRATLQIPMEPWCWGG